MSTIRDIAKRAGVAVSTASLALNGDKRVRNETRERILKAAQELNYHPMRAARSLSSGRTWSFQLLNPVTPAALSSGFFTRFAQGIHDIARENRYTVALSILDDESEAQQVLDRFIFERWSDGIILMNPTDNAALLERLRETQFPHVLLGRCPHGEALSVDNDNMHVGLDATLHLLRGGARPLLFLNGPARQTFTDERAEGYRRAHQQLAHPVDANLMRFIPGSADAARQEVTRLLADGVTFRGVLAASDAQALGAMRALHEHGLEIPKDVAVMGMNNDDVAEFTSPTLSSVELNAYELGRSAASLLLEAVEEGSLVKKRHLVSHHLVLRESTGSRPEVTTP